jgi:hypothetical protein
MISNFSFQRAEEVIKKLVNVFVSKSSLHKLFEESKTEISQIEEEVKEISLDGGNVCLRSGEWKQYKAARSNKKEYGGWYQKNDEMVDWMERNKLGSPVICLGDGHDGVWNIFDKISERK